MAMALASVSRQNLLSMISAENFPGTTLLSNEVHVSNKIQKAD